MSKMIPYGCQDLNEKDIQAVVEVLKSNWLTQGPTIESFEKAVADYCGARYAVAVNSATSALHIACLAAGLDSGDVLWTSPNTFVASANCGLYCGAKVDFVDVDERNYNMDAVKLEQKLQEAEKAGALPKVVVPVHFSGQSCDMEAIGALAKKYPFTIVEDASHAIGGSYRNLKIGCCQYSDMTVFSFHPVKIVTTGEGGVVVTNRKDLYDKLIRLRSHGITRDTKYMTEESHGPWYYQQIDLGFNYRITDIQASLGISQLKRIDTFIERRRQIADTYNRELADLPLILPHQEEYGQSAWHLYVICLDSTKTKKKRLEVFNSLRQMGIGVNVHYIPVHTQPYYQQQGFKQGDFPCAERYYEQALSIPMFAKLTAEDQEYVISCLKKVLQ